MRIERWINAMSGISQLHIIVFLTREIVHKLVSKSFVAKMGLSILVLCNASFLLFILCQFTRWPPSIDVHYAIY